MSNKVLIRTYSAGVHFGTLVSQTGKEVKLSNAQRIWRWTGANTLNEVATKGVNSKKWTRISEAVSEITLTEAIEIIPISAEAEATLAPVWND
jgi:hypothetical protein